MRKSFRYRLYPTKRQILTLERQLTLMAELYNAAVQERRDAWRFSRIHVSCFDQIYQLPEIKKLRPELAEVNANALEDVLRRVDRAFCGFFRRVKKGSKPGFPRFRSARRYDSLTFRQGLKTALAGNKLRIPKVGQVKIKLHRPIEGVIKQLHIKREARHWFAVFCVEFEPVPLPLCKAQVGIDVGLAAFATLDDGTEIENPRYLERSKAALRRAQRRVARRKKGSRGRRDAVTLLQQAHALVRRQRADFHHRISRRIVNTHGLIAVEDLNVKGLATGRLAKSVNDAAWGQFLNFIAYKAEWAGRVFVRVNPSGTSQTCICGAGVPKALKERWHSCESCGLSAPRDHVSAQVILQRALAAGAQASTWPVTACVA